MLARTFVLLLVALLAGCGAETHTYTISVKNEAFRPVTIALTKTGGPAEDKWASPEDIARGLSKSSAEHGIAVVAAGRTATVKDVKGSFPDGAQAVVRVYRGDPTFGEMLKMEPGLSRVDLTLHAGRNDLVVRETAAGLAVSERVGQ